MKEGGREKEVAMATLEEFRRRKGWDPLPDKEAIGSTH